MTIQDRFWAKVDKSGGCWVWTAARNFGYGLFGISSGKNVRAHRFAWEQERGPIPEGMVLDHLCRNRACVNPDHLEVTTSGENVLRGISVTAINARKTHCKYGHEFTPENTMPTKNRYGLGRKCRACHREAQRRYLERKGWASV